MELVKLLTGFLHGEVSELVARVGTGNQNIMIPSRNIDDLPTKDLDEESISW